MSFRPCDPTDSCPDLGAHNAPAAQTLRTTGLFGVPADSADAVAYTQDSLLHPAATSKSAALMTLRPGKQLLDGISNRCTKIHRLLLSKQLEQFLSKGKLAYGLPQAAYAKPNSMSGSGVKDRQRRDPGWDLGAAFGYAQRACIGRAAMSEH